MLVCILFHGWSNNCLDQGNRFYAMWNLERSSYCANTIEMPIRIGKNQTVE